MASRTLSVKITGDARKFRKLGNPTLWRRIRGVFRRHRRADALMDAYLARYEIPDREALDALRAEMAVCNEQAQKIAAISQREALKALADVISGEIVGRRLPPRDDAD